MPGKARISEKEAIRLGIIPPRPPYGGPLPDWLQEHPRGYGRFSPGFKKALTYIAWWFFGIFCGVLFK